MRVNALWRYPVKSMTGERLANLDLTERGIVGDRIFGVLDLASGTIVSAKRDARLLLARALLAGVTLTVRLPTGETALGTGPGVDMALSAWLGRRVRLVEVAPEGRGTYQGPADFEDDESPMVAFDGPYGSFVDVGPVHLLTTASLRAMASERPDLPWDVARFRPNLLIEVDGVAPVEQDWIGCQVRVGGGVELEVTGPCQRCVMTTRAQPGGVERRLDVLRHINAHHQGNLGVLARVTRRGRVDMGASAELVDR